MKKKQHKKEMVKSNAQLSKVKKEEPLDSDDEEEAEKVSSCVSLFLLAVCWLASIVF